MNELQGIAIGWRLPEEEVEQEENDDDEEERHEKSEKELPQPLLG